MSKTWSQSNRAKRAYLIPAVHKLFDAYSHYKGISASAVINKALYEFFSKMDNGTKEVIVKEYKSDLDKGLVTPTKGRERADSI